MTQQRIDEMIAELRRMQQLKMVRPGQYDDIREARQQLELQIEIEAKYPTQAELNAYLDGIKAAKEAEKQDKKRISQAEQKRFLAELDAIRQVEMEARRKRFYEELNEERERKAFEAQEQKLLAAQERFHKQLQNKYNTERAKYNHYIAQAYTLYGDSYDYSLIDQVNFKVREISKIRCVKHDILFETTFSKHLRDYCCPECAEIFDIEKRDDIKLSKKKNHTTYPLHTEENGFEITDNRWGIMRNNIITKYDYDRE